jgi:hypothetical protein
MNRLATAVICFLIAWPTAETVAQERQRASFKTSAQNTKYTQQHLIDVGDVPGHQVRIYEIHRTFPADPPVINGWCLCFREWR